MKESMKSYIMKMPPCPICGKKAYMMHDVADGMDFGYSVGCPSFCLNDGVHGITKSYDPEAPRVNGYSAQMVFDKWLEYCKRKGGKKGHSTLLVHGRATQVVEVTE